MNAFKITLRSLVLIALMMSQSAGAAENLAVVTIPGSTDVAAKDVAPDIMLAVLAVSQTLRGDRDLSKGLGTTQFAPGAKIASHDAGPNGGGFRYDGYQLAGVTINIIEPSPRTNPGRRVTGLLQFQNLDGLRAQTAFMIDYGYSPKGVVVHDLQAMPLTPADARVVLRALPLKDGQALLQQRPRTIEAFLEQTASRARRMPLPAGDWMLVAISPDRVLPGDRLVIHVGSEAGKIDPKAPPAMTFDYAGFPVAAVAWRSGGQSAIASVFLHTDMHPNKSNGRRLLGTVGLTNLAAGAAISAVPRAAGGWSLDDDANPTQLAFATPERADDPELLISCDRPNNELHVLYRKLSSDDAEAARDKLDTLNAAIAGAGTSMTLSGFISRAPEATAVGYDILSTDDSAAVLTVPDLTWKLPGMTIATPLTPAAAQFVQACPKVGTAAGSMTWRRRINLAAGYAIDLPFGFFRLASADRSGRFYRGGPGNGTLQVSNVVNQDDMTPREALKRMTQDKDVVTKVAKSAASKDTLTITGTRGSRAMFLKAILTCEKSQWAIVRLEYDAAARGEVEPLLGRIEQSFTPQGEYEGQAACE